jgi:predicted AlkP superfamily phosphohydrolase/phosphomutase
MSGKPGRPSVLLLGLDAVDADVVDRLAGDGRLPNLQRLMETGLRGRLRSPADLFAGGVWPTFYTGRHVPSHGIFHNKLWRPDRMRIDVAGDDWIPARPFWETLPDPGLRVCIVDVPMVLGAPRPVNGVYLGGWGTHDLISRGSWPPGLWRDCERRFGAPLMPAEHFGRQSADAVADLRQRLGEATRQLTDLALDLLGREPWDLACVVLSAGHRAGHYLWDRSQVDDAAPPARSPHSDLAAVYTAVDEAVGRVLARTSPDTLVLAFAVHGMGPNPGWSDLLPDLLARMDQHRSGARPSRGFLYRLKQVVPFHWARPLLNALPMAVNHRLVSLWSRNMFDWSSTPWFPVPMDESGYLRVNLRGRERDGIVEPGPAYDALCDELEQLMLGLRDADSGEPLARGVTRAFAAASEGASHAAGRALLPDLVVPWTGPPATSTRRVLCDALPGFVYEVPARLPSGRAGNHTDRAWFIAHGPGVVRGAAIRTHDVVDLVPTALHHLGVAPPQAMDGSPMDLTELR